MKNSIYFIFIVMLLISCKKSKLSTQNNYDVNQEVNNTKPESFLDLFKFDIELNGLKSCGFTPNKENQVSDEMIKKYGLLTSDIVAESQDIAYLIKKDEFKVHAISKKRIFDYYLLLYRVQFNDAIGDELRLLIFKNDKVIDNLFFCGNIADEGESNVCRTLSVFGNLIVLHTDTTTDDFKKFKSFEYLISILN